MVCSEALPVKSQVRSLREQRGWSQGELADQLEVSRQTVNAIETEKYDPSIKLAFKMSRLFELPIESIFQIFSDLLVLSCLPGLPGPI